MGIKRGQAWSFDLIIAISIFMISLIAFYIYMMNSSSVDGTYSLMKKDAIVISDMLMSDGDPADWQQSNVIVPGILSNGQINGTKLLALNEMAETDYNNTKTVFRTSYEYYLNFSEPLTVDSTTIQGIGRQNNGSGSLIKFERVTSYNDKPITLSLFIWK